MKDEMNRPKKTKLSVFYHSTLFAMETFVLVLGWYNFLGSIVMLGFFRESFGRKLLNEWTKIFAKEFSLDYWSRLWLFWAAGMNILFGLMNIMAAVWEFIPLLRFVVVSDIIAYSVFFALAIRAYLRGQFGVGGYVVFAIFASWLLWGISTLFT